eukprot:1160679-Pelagomonas_calceolata.AAC.20
MPPQHAQGGVAASTMDCSGTYRQRWQPARWTAQTRRQRLHSAWMSLRAGRRAARKRGRSAQACPESGGG